MIVVTGATGNVGRTLVRTLVAAGEEVTAVSRSTPQPELSIPHHRVDLARPEGLKEAVDGADSLFLLTSGDWVASGGNADVIHDILDIARSGGVRKVVLLSSQGVATGSHAPDLEEAVKRSGLEWTMVQPGGFDSNAFQWAESVRAHRTVTAPFGDIALPTVDPDDIAAVAAVALREDGHGGKSYVVTGPAPISPRQQTAAIADALGEPVRFVEQTPDEARAQMLQFMPEPVVTSTLSILGNPSPAEQSVSPDVERLLGRAPGSFADWAKRNVAAFR